MSSGQIAGVSGVSATTIAKVALGHRKTVLRRNALGIMAVQASSPVTLGNVSSLGAVRRLRALYALGHYQHEIAAVSGLSRDFISGLAVGHWSTLALDRDRAIRQAYDALAMRVGASWKTRRLAESHGWAPPLAWDDDTIDDPKALPQMDAAAPRPTEGANVVDRFLLGESVVLGNEGRRQAIQHLMEWTNLTPDEVGARMEMSADAVSRSWERLKAAARAEGRPVPWRRVYVSLQDKDMTRDDMRSAA
ncbi:hypothetical protein [Streptomyces sp. AcH 505]|uniref:hypothetical protein n=1 Tax=Streptomyces sp. AcH 505 TaxID=352211 RepID=UPI0012FF576F